MSENIGIGSYQDLSSSANAIKNTSGELKDELANGDTYISRLQNPRVLEGPIGEHINGIWKMINNTTNNNINSFEENSKKLNRVEDNYHDIDNKSSNDVGGVI